MSERVYQKGDPEYLSNGHYEIEGVSFMSIWTFKNKNGVKPNTREQNGIDGTELFNYKITKHMTRPDLENGVDIAIYPEGVLAGYYAQDPADRK